MIVSPVARRSFSRSVSFLAEANTCISNLTANINRFIVRPSATFSEHLAALYSLSTHFPAARDELFRQAEISRFMVHQKTAVPSVSKPLFEAIVSPELVAEFRDNCHNLLNCIGHMAKMIRNSNYSEDPKAAKNALSALVVLTLSVKQICLWESVHLNREMRGLTVGLKSALDKVLSELKSKSNDPENGKEIELVRFYMNISLMWTIEQELQNWTGDYGTLFNAFKVETERYCRNFSTYELTLAYSSIKSMPVLNRSIGPFILPKLEEVLFRKWNLKATANKDQTLDSYIENKANFLPMFVKRIESENVMNDFLVFQNLLIQTGLANGLKPAGKTLQGIFKLIITPTLSNRLLMFRNLGNFYSQLADELMAQQASSVDTDSYKTVLLAATLKLNLSAEELKKLTDIADVFYQSENEQLRAKKSSESEIAFLHYLMTLTFMGQTFPLSNTQNNQRLLEVMRKLCQKAHFLGGISIVETVKMISVLQNHLFAQNDLKSYDQLQQTYVMFLKNLIANLHKHRPLTLVRLLVHLPPGIYEELLIAVKTKLDGLTKGMFKMQASMSFLHYLFNSELPETQNFAAKHSESLINNIVEFDLDSEVKEWKRENTSVFNSEIVSLRNSLADTDFCNFPPAKTGEQQIAFIEQVGQKLACFNQLLTIKRHASEQIHEYPILTTNLLRIETIFRLIYPFFKVHREKSAALQQEYAKLSDNLRYYMQYCANGLWFLPLEQLFGLAFNQTQVDDDLVQYSLSILRNLLTHIANLFCVKYELLPEVEIKRIQQFLLRSGEHGIELEQFGRILQRGAEGYFTNYSKQFSQSELVDWLVILNEAGSLNDQTALNISLHIVKQHNKEILRMGSYFDYCTAYRDKMDSFLECLFVLSQQQIFLEAADHQKQALEEFKNNLIEERSQVVSLATIQFPNFTSFATSSYQFRFTQFLTQKNIQMKRNVKFLTSTFHFYLPEQRLFVKFTEAGKLNKERSLATQRRVLTAADFDLVVFEEPKINTLDEQAEINFGFLCRKVDRNRADKK